MPSDPVAEFLARGGKITKVEPGAQTMSHKDWYNAERGIKPPEPVYTDEQLSEMEHEIVSQAVLVGGQSAAINALNEVRSPARRRQMRRITARDYAAQARYNDEWGVDY